MIGRSISSGRNVNVWVKQKAGPDKIMQVIPSPEDAGTVNVYHLYSAFDRSPDFMGSVLFDKEGYWIYDGDVLTIDEQEQVARFIINYQDR